MSTARPKFGDHLLAERGITVVAGAERGRTIPTETPLTALRPIRFLREGDGSSINGPLMQERALDETGPCFAPWGRDLLWRILNNQDGEGEVFLATLDKTKYYVFAGDQDLQRPGGNAVVLCLYWDGGQRCWNYGCVGSYDWYVLDQLRILGDSC